MLPHGDMVGPIDQKIHQVTRKKINVREMSSVVNDYGSASYWDERYSSSALQEATKSSDGTYDWYNSYENLRFALRRIIIPDEGDEDNLKYSEKPEEMEILIVGCGNSTLGCKMYDDGFHNITNIDISEVVINQMIDKYSSKEHMEYTIMDARDMELIPNECFDVIIDKALFDALLCGENNLDSVQKMLREVFRCLKTGGRYVMISHAPSASRMHYLTSSPLQWDVEVMEVPKPTLTGSSKKNDDKKSDFHYIYSCRK